MEVEGQRVETPTAEKLKFKHHFKKLRCPFVFFNADFECLTKGIEEPEDENIKTYNYQEQKPCGFVLHLVVNAVDNTNHEFLHRGADAVSVFCT